MGSSEEEEAEGRWREIGIDVLAKDFWGAFYDWLLAARLMAAASVDFRFVLFALFTREAREFGVIGKWGSYFDPLF